MDNAKQDDPVGLFLLPDLARLDIFLDVDRQAGRIYDGTVVHVQASLILPTTAGLLGGISFTFSRFRFSVHTPSHGL